MIAMSAITVRQLPEETRRALKVRAAQNGRSTEAEIRDILQNAVRPRAGLGSALRAIGQESGGFDMVFPRDPSPAEAATFE